MRTESIPPAQIIRSKVTYFSKERETKKERESLLASPEVLKNKKRREKKKEASEIV
jgi:hypothetical protein